MKCRRRLKEDSVGFEAQSQKGNLTSGVEVKSGYSPINARRQCEFGMNMPVTSDSRCIGLKATEQSNRLCFRTKSTP